jgi:hypothetical protein
MKKCTEVPLSQNMVGILPSTQYTPGHAVVQLVAALRYKPEGRGFDYRWCQWNFSLT